MSNEEIKALENDALAINMEEVAGELTAYMQAPECTDGSVGGGGGGTLG